MIGCSPIPSIPATPPATLPVPPPIGPVAGDVGIHQSINYSDPHTMAVMVGLVLIALCLPQFKMAWYWNAGIGLLGAGLVLWGVR